MMPVIVQHFVSKTKIRVSKHVKHVSGYHHSRYILMLLGLSFVNPLFPIELVNNPADCYEGIRES